MMAGDGSVREPVLEELRWIGGNPRIGPADGLVLQALTIEPGEGLRRET